MSETATVVAGSRNHTQLEALERELELIHNKQFLKAVITEITDDKFVVDIYDEGFAEFATREGLDACSLGVRETYVVGEPVNVVILQSGIVVIMPDFEIWYGKATVDWNADDNFVLVRACDEAGNVASAAYPTFKIGVEFPLGTTSKFSEISGGDVVPYVRFLTPYQNCTGFALNRNPQYVLFPVLLTKDGGDDGDGTLFPTYTYTVTSLEDTVLGTLMSPVWARFFPVPTTPAENGTAYIKDGTVVLFQTDEVPANTNCGA